MRWAATRRSVRSTQPPTEAPNSTCLHQGVRGGGWVQAMHAPHWTVGSGPSAAAAPGAAAAVAAAASAVHTRVQASAVDTRVQASR